MAKQTFGSTIAAFRKEKGITQLDLAQKHGCHRQSGLEMGEKSFFS